MGSHRKNVHEIFVTTNDLKTYICYRRNESNTDIGEKQTVNMFSYIEIEINLTISTYKIILE